MTEQPSDSVAPAVRLQSRLRLQDLVDIRILEQLQDWFAATTGISVSLRDPDGNLITEPKRKNPFCALVTSVAQGYEHCRASNARAVQRAAAEGKPVKYVCHAGLTQFAAPIMVAGEMVATLVLGDRPATPLPRTSVERLADELGIPREKLAAAAESLILWSDETMERAAHFLSDMAHAITDICYQGYLLRARLRELSTLYETSQLLTSTLDLQEVLRLMAKHVTEVLGVRACSIRLLEHHGRELAIQSYYNLSRRYINKGPVLVARSQIDQAAMRGEVVHIKDMTTDPRILYPREAAEEGLRSGLVVGLFAKGRPIGALHLYASEVRDFSEDEIRLLRAMANQAAIAIENARLYKDSLAKQALDKELAIAAEIQEQLLPDKAPAVPGLDIQAMSLPSQQVGGDFYDFIPIDDGHLGIVIADVAGKGIPAALLMATSRAALRAQAERKLRPNRVLQSLNRVLRRDTALEHFITCFYGVIEVPTRVLRYTNAGHNPPMHLRDGRINFLRTGGVVLGVTTEPRYATGRIVLKPGDVCVLYTDGVTESLDPQGHTFSERRVAEVVRRCAHQSAEEILTAICDELMAFTSGAPPRDDQTLVVIKAT